MTEEEKIKKIEALYAEALAKIKALEEEQKQIVANFIKDLDAKKIEALRADLTK